MTTLELHKPGKKKLEVQVPFPTEWNDLYLPELYAVARLLLSPNADAAKGKAAIFMELLQYRVKHHNIILPTGWEAMLNLDDCSTKGLDAVQFIYDRNGLTRQPLPGISFGFHTHLSVVGPADDFNNITCGEFEDAEVFCTQFLIDPNITHLAMLAAILWRPKDQPYIWLGSNGIQQTWPADAYAKHFAGLPPEQLYTMFLWYCGCTGTLPLLFPDVYSGNKSEGERDAAAFTKCIHAGAGEKNGTRQQIRLMPLKEFLFEMDLQAKQAKELEAEIKRNSNS